MVTLTTRGELFAPINKTKFVVVHQQHGMKGLVGCRTSKVNIFLWFYYNLWEHVSLTGMNMEAIKSKSRLLEWTHVCLFSILSVVYNDAKPLYLGTQGQRTQEIKG